MKIELFPSTLKNKQLLFVSHCAKMIQILSFSFYSYPLCSVSQSVVRVPPGVREEFGGGTHCTRVWWGYVLHRAQLRLILRSHESSQDSLVRREMASSIIIEGVHICQKFGKHCTPYPQASTNRTINLQAISSVEAVS